MSQDFSGELVGGCEAVLDPLRLSEYRRHPQICIVDLYRACVIELAFAVLALLVPVQVS